MKSLITTVIFIFITASSVHAQKNAAILEPLLNSYYEVKNALVNSDLTLASTRAGEFVRAAKNIDAKALPEDKSNAFVDIQKKIISDAENISATKDITKQRNYFANFSLDFYSLIKAVGVGEQAVYKLYCPMKKTYWLSNETSIKNPYFGNAMLTCGNVAETINP